MFVSTSLGVDFISLLSNYLFPCFFPLPADSVFFSAVWCWKRQSYHLGGKKHTLVFSLFPLVSTAFLSCVTMLREAFSHVGGEQKVVFISVRFFCVILSQLCYCVCVFFFYFFFPINGNTERAQCAVSQVFILWLINLFIFWISFPLPFLPVYSIPHPPL